MRSEYEASLPPRGPNRTCILSNHARGVLIVRPEIWPGADAVKQGLKVLGDGRYRMLSETKSGRRPVIGWTSLLRQEFYAWLRDGCGQRFRWGDAMIRSSSTRTVVNLGMASALAMFLGACGSMSLPSFSSGPSAPAEASGSAGHCRRPIRADEIAGRWGLASYQNPNDRARTEKAAQGQCKQPYVITVGPTGGVVMHLADQANAAGTAVEGQPERQELHRARPDRSPASRTAKSSPLTGAFW